MDETRQTRQPTKRVPQKAHKQSTYLPKLYGRRQGKSLKPRQMRLMETLLPSITIPDPTSENIDPKELFPDAKSIWLELGFGGGEHLATLAKDHPDIGFIGAEPFLDGIGKLLAMIADEDVKNIRLLPGDGRPLLEAVPNNSIERLFVLHPDPWPKRRHFKRRLVSPWFFKEAARIMPSNGILRIASDVPDYVRWTLMHAQNSKDFQWLAKTAADWQNRPSDWPATRYGEKSIREGRSPIYLTFRRQ
ncbi:MAG: tRNA (guanosine(46)-N7)-methyltransferase TrmB [Pseudomonadota bacterium]